MSEVKDKDSVRSLKPEIQALSEKIVSGIEIDKKTGVITEIANNYIDNLPEGITSEIDQTLSVYRSQFIAASADAAGTIAVQAMKDNKKLDSATSVFKMGEFDTVSHGISREQTYGYGPATDRQTVVKHGVVITDLDVRGARNAGQLKVARERIGAMAAELFNKTK